MPTNTRTALYHCQTVEDIPQKIDAIIDALGKSCITTLFRGKKVLLKPNICIDHPPEKGATTHPAVLDAVIAIAKAYGAHVIVGDGAAVGVRGRIFEKTGIQTVCERHGVKLIDFNRDPGQTLYLDNAFALDHAHIAQTYFEVDTIVNLPVFKSNMLYWVSGALKNMKGLLVGMEKHRPHSLGVPQCVADLNRMVRQDLIIMDGTIGMMGDGPAAGNPANARLLIGGFDPLAVDALAATLMGFRPKKIPMLHWAEQAGVGSINYEALGDPLQSFNLNFEKPAIAKKRILSTLMDLGGRLFFGKMGQGSKMVVDHEACTLCGRCKAMCPFGAITIKNKTVQIDHEKCEFCLCCTEVCKEEAIELQGMLTRKDAFLRG